MDIGVMHYLVVSSALFFIGVLGVVVNYRNIIVLLMSIELMLLAANLNFVAFSHFLEDRVGQIFCFFILAIAAAEAAIGLAILVAFFRSKGTAEVDSTPLMKG